MPLIQGIAHCNLTVPHGTLEVAAEFYEGVLGLKRITVPVLQKDVLAWFEMPTGQQIHISHPKTLPPGSLTDNAPDSARHPCFHIDSMEDLQTLQKRIWEHYEKKVESSPAQADQPGEVNSGARGVEYPSRFFARDYANNRLEFSL